MRPPPHLRTPPRTSSAPWRPALSPATPPSGFFVPRSSFISGAKNNLLGMVGFVKQREAANKNYNERIEFEEKVAMMVAEKRAQRAAAAAAAAAKHAQCKK